MFLPLAEKQIFEVFCLGHPVSLPKRRLAVVAKMFAKSVGKSRLLVGESGLLVGKSHLFNFAGFLLEIGKCTNCPEAQKGDASTKRQFLLKRQNKVAPRKIQVCFV